MYILPLLPCLQIDLQKMPLGKLSKRQIQSAYALLTDVQQVSSQQSDLEGCLANHLHIGIWGTHYTFLSDSCDEFVTTISASMPVIGSDHFSIIGCVRLFARGPDTGSLQSLLHPDPSRLWYEETSTAQQPGLHSGGEANAVSCCANFSHY